MGTCGNRLSRRRVSLDCRMSCLDLSLRPYQALSSHWVRRFGEPARLAMTVGDVVEMLDDGVIGEVYGLGPKGVAEVEQAVRKALPSWVPRAVVRGPVTLASPRSWLELPVRMDRALRQHPVGPWTDSMARVGTVGDVVELWRWGCVSAVRNLSDDSADLVQARLVELGLIDLAEELAAGSRLEAPRLHRPGLHLLEPESPVSHLNLPVVAARRLSAHRLGAGGSVRTVGHELAVWRWGGLRTQAMRRRRAGAVVEARLLELGLISAPRRSPEMTLMGKP